MMKIKSVIDTLPQWQDKQLPCKDSLIDLHSKSNYLGIRNTDSIRNIATLPYVIELISDVN
jgi:hypothetical protein